MTSFLGRASRVILLAQLLQSPALLLVHALSPCNVCPFNQVITNPDAIVPAGTAGFIESDSSCADVASMAENGSFTLGQCVLLRSSGVSEICGCAAPPTQPPASVPSPPPVDVPTPNEAPTAKPVTDSPSASPVALPPPIPAPVTDAPSPAPTLSPVTDAPTASPVKETSAPTTAAPVTEAPTTAAPIAEAPTTGSPVLEAAPTMAPAISNGTGAPTTLMPTPEPLPVVLGVAFIRILTVGPGDLPKAADEGFALACETFFAERIDEATDFNCFTKTNKVTPIPGGGRQLRKLEDNGNTGSAENALDVTAEVQATSKSFDYEPSTAEFTTYIIDLINANSTDFTKLLRESGSAESQLYYSNANSTEAFQQGEAPTFAPLSPTEAPVAPPSSDSGTDDDGLSGGVIAGIVAGCVVGAVVLVGVANFAVNKNPHPQPSVLEVGSPSGGFTPMPPTTSISTSKTAANKKVANGDDVVPTSSLKASAKPGSSMVSTTKEPPRSSTTASAAKLSGDPSGIMSTSETDILVEQPPELAEDASAVTGGSDVMADRDGEENSYAYSLDAGQMEGQSTMAGTATKSGSAGDGMDKSETGSEMSSHAMSSLRQNMVSRTVIAPPGKLGIVIDTTLEGPVVHKVNPQSPLEGTLFTGDIIVAIDDVDTRAMSASAITALMVRTANLRRKLTVLSEDNTS